MGIFEFFAVMLTAITIENVIFARALGLTGSVITMDNPKEIMSYGTAYTWLTLLSSLGAVLVRHVTSHRVFSPLFQALILVGLVIAAYLLTYYLAKGLFPKGIESIRQFLPLTAFNTALFGVLYLLNEGAFTLGRSIAYSLGAGIGYTLAMFMILAAKRRLAMSPVPRSFRGVPILLVYLGILSLALYGLLGHGLPT